MAVLKLEVHLDTSLNPPVRISNRSANASGARVRWEKKKNANPDFKFVRLNDLDQVHFNQQSIDLDQKKVRCNNRAPFDSTRYPYTLVVESGGVEYDSTIQGGGPGGDKPVIRNN